MNNGVNNSENQTIPGVKVAPPSDKPVDATTNDVGAAVNKGIYSTTSQAINNTTSVGNVPVQTQPVVTSNITQNPSLTMPFSDTNVKAGEVPVIVSTMSALEKTDTTDNSSDSNVKTKRKKGGNRILLLIIVLLLGGCAFLWFYHQEQIKLMNIKCTPVSTTNGSKELDLDSTVVRDLYSKVYTTIREDLGEVELNDSLKLYLAYRQIPTSGLYDSHCNMFKATGMEPFTCQESSSFVPKAFKTDTLQLEIKKMFGEDTNISNQNIQLGKTCIGGFQYIEERGEYVQGQCLSTGATMYRADKELIGATSNEAYIILRERVKYYGSEGLEVPSKLVSGVYVYTFKLDMNYNYIYISKSLEE